MKKRIFFSFIVVCLIILIFALVGCSGVEEISTNKTDSDDYKYVYLMIEENDDRFEYDEFGNKTKWIQKDRTVQYKNTYDDTGRLKMTYYEWEKDRSTTYTYLYDSKGYKIKEEMLDVNGWSNFANGYETTFINDEAGKPIQCDMKTITNGKVDEGVTTTMLQYTEAGVLKSLTRYYKNGDVGYEEYNEYGDVITETTYKNGRLYNEERIDYRYEFDEDNNIIKKTVIFEDGTIFEDTYKWEKVKIKLPNVCETVEDVNKESDYDINQKSIDVLSEYLQTKNIKDSQLTYLGIHSMMNSSYYDYLHSDGWHILVQTVEPYNIYIAEGYETEAIMVWPEENASDTNNEQESIWGDIDEQGKLVDSEGNIIMSAEDLAQQEN